MRRVASVLAIGVFVLAVNFAAGPVKKGTISGTVKDEKGAPLSGVLVRLMDTDRAITTSVITGGGGSYYADSLFPGNYELRAERRGFETSVKRGVHLDARASVDLVLKERPHAVAPLRSGDIFAQFPEDQDKALMVDTCFRCHSMLTLYQTRKNREGWQKTITAMAARRRSNMTGHEVDRLVNYFAKHFNMSRPAPPPFVDEPEPPAKGGSARLTEYSIPDQGTPEVMVPSTNSAPIFPHNITAAPDGIVWFAMYKANKIGRLDPVTGQFRSYPVPTKGSVPHGITYAADGSIWFTEARGDKVGHLDPKTGAIVEIATNSGGNTIARDSQGNMYLTMGRTNQIGKVNTKTGESTAYDLLAPNAQPYGIIVDQKDYVWWCQLFTDSIGRLDPKTGKITEYPTPTKMSAPRRLAVDSSGNVWFTEWMANKLGKLDPATGKITEYDLPTPASEPYEVAVDVEDTVWVAGYLSNTIARFDRAKETFVEYPIPTPRGEIRKMAADPRQGIWFAESHTDTIGHMVVKR